MPLRLGRVDHMVLSKAVSGVKESEVFNTRQLGEHLQFDEVDPALAALTFRHERLVFAQSFRSLCLGQASTCSRLA